MVDLDAHVRDVLLGLGGHDIVALGEGLRCYLHTEVAAHGLRARIVSYRGFALVILWVHDAVVELAQLAVVSIGVLHVEEVVTARVEPTA